MPSLSKKKIQKKILSILKKNKSGLSAKDLSKNLAITHHDYHFFRKALIFLKSSGQISKSKGNKKYVLSSKSRTLEGELSITRSGFGFLHDKENNIDVFIGRDHLNTAFDTDLVEVKLFASSRGKNEEGYVSKIIKRKRIDFVGTYHKTQYYGYVVPDNPKVYRDFFIPKEKQKNAQNGQKVVVTLEKWDTDHLNPEGFIKKIIGYTGEPGVDVTSVAYSHQLEISFPDLVEKEVQQIKDDITEEEIACRTDLRDMQIFTIDPEDAKDFDDAVSLEKLSNGNYLLGVHIADVSYYVKENSQIDQEALKRGTSVYLVDRVIPMLPEKLSNHTCSLQPHCDKLTYSCFMEISDDGRVVEYKIVPSIISSKRRFNYEEAQEILNSNSKDPFFHKLSMMMNLSKIFSRKRLSEGGIDFETPEVSFVLDEKGFPLAIKRKKRLDSHRLIEEFMLLTNRTVAEHILKMSTKEQLLPFIYRVHDKPDSEKMVKFFEFLTALGYKFNALNNITSKELQKILNKIQGTNEEIIIEEVALRSMMKAEYSIQNIGHFGLGFRDYTHFTSPIRRYPDLTVHRLLKKYSQTSISQDFISIKKFLKKVCEQATKMERTALEAERESIRLKQNEYISQHINEQFKGIISGVTSFGFFVELIDTLVEGLVHVKDLNDFFIYDEKTYTLIGRDSDIIFRLGDEVTIEVKEVNLEEGKVDFILIAKNN